MDRTLPASWRLPRLAYLVVVAVVIAIGIVNVLWAVTDWHFNDLHAYYSAAERLRSGEVLYGGDVTPWTAYRYAPWFAFAFLPLSLLPWGLAAVVWTTFTMLCSLLAIWPLLRSQRREALLLAGIMGPLLVALSASGNVQAPMIALLVWALGTRWGPIAIGIAASLKMTPILLVLAYFGTGEWRKAVLSAAVTAFLWAPIILFRIEPITFDFGGAAVTIVVWITLAAIGILGAIVVSRRWPRYRLLAASVAVYLITPRLYLYDATILLVSSRARAAR